MPVPANLGTPGARNSRYSSNAGPAVYQVSHNPAIPAASQPVVVTARVHDPSGVQSVVLNYRIDPSITYTSVPMKDEGTGGDAVANDGIFSATIPGQVARTVVAFYISATDTKLAATRFPILLNNGCLLYTSLTTPCSASGTVWTCELTLANGTAAEAIWDTSQICSDGTCTTSNQNVSTIWTN